MDQQPSAALGFREVDRDGNPVPPESEGVEYARTWHAPNPFIVVLWLLAAGLIAGGAGALLSGPVVTGPSSGGIPLAYIVYTFAPQVVVAGFATVVFLLFWHAWQWQRRRG
ncbi:hypothetical protein FBY30_0888 [Arthrobacter sp. SLBN-83]|uniref:hypothetical protein n=1 Tax=Arthrobacter sp. SLBN-83 TaxID=2768449 RepID=UPI0011526CE3|nr:hypothetical protein [Arthrobacter sp. SLBN-83]TQJ58653.1 hypothetical protein FBY30_0888 [Arthrobacter sp. SLBN-83]